MSHEFDTELGVLPSEGPLPYLFDDGRPAEERAAGPLPETATTWWHRTHEPVPTIAARQGLIPSCWRGGDACVVFGRDRRRVLRGQGEVVIEVCSRALPGELKALWVPWWCVIGVWREDGFTTAEELRTEPVELLDAGGGCECQLSDFMIEQQRLWRETWR
ncbi:MAG: hypothetical protein ACJ75S_11360 [Solirubrobacterales bacterium]